MNRDPVTSDTQNSLITMDNTYRLTTGQILAYTCGMVGWSILNNLIAVMLIYFYLPPKNSGLDPLIPNIIYLKIFSVLALIAAGGRLFDAITDPLIAWMSDRSTGRKGRRIPFMRVSWIPAFVFCFIVFLPFYYSESKTNITWLIFSLMFFYLFITIYFIPYNALMPELAPGGRDKVRLSTWMSLAYVLGLIFAAQTPLLADMIRNGLDLAKRVYSFQISIGILCALAGVFLMIPTFLINEKNCCPGVPARIPFRTSLIQTLGNYNFRLFLFTDFSYFMAVAIISSGMLYYLKVLLNLEEAMGSTVFGLMIIVSLLFYPFVLHVSKFIQKKYLISSGLIFLGCVFLGIYFLGHLPFRPAFQIYLFALLASLPVAILGIIPYAIIAEIAQLDSLRTGLHKEGMYFAVRNFFYKLGMTAGIMCFTILTLWGKDPGNDFGIRLNGIFGFALCVIAGITFLTFKEKRIIDEINELLNKNKASKEQ
jgi:GPH family glycoside/pentoside/hexuronide:cation symporter